MNAAHIPGMSKKIIRKQDTREPGNPGGFGTHTRSAAEDNVLTAPASRPSVHAEPGDSVELDASSFGMPDLKSVHVSRSLDGDGYFMATTVAVPLLEWAPEGFGPAEKAQWLENRLPTIHTFLRNRYGATLTGVSTWDDPVEKFEHAGAETALFVEQDTAGFLDLDDVNDAIWSRGTTRRMAAEFDHNTWSSVNAGHAFEDYLKNRAVAATPGSLSREHVESEVDTRVGVREINAETARSIARHLVRDVTDHVVENVNIPALEDLAFDGHADKEQLRESIAALYAQDRRHQTRRWMDMLQTWRMNAAPEDA